MEHMKKKNITIDDLAVMVQKGFEETAKKTEISKRFDVIEDRLDSIEKMILSDYKRRIEKLEMRVEELRDALAIK
jgi:hypothetical protein